MGTLPELVGAVPSFIPPGRPAPAMHRIQVAIAFIAERAKTFHDPQDLCAEGMQAVLSAGQTLAEIPLPAMPGSGEMAQDSEDIEAGEIVNYRMVLSLFLALLALPSLALADCRPYTVLDLATGQMKFCTQCCTGQVCQVICS